jgi:transcriptional regulator with XRE-family HTH domain
LDLCKIRTAERRPSSQPSVASAKIMRRHSDSQRQSTIDVHIGSRLRQRRTLVGMTQNKLATALGITFQQVQKYESGVNRVSGSRLYDLANALDIPVSFFFDGVPVTLATTAPSPPLPDVVQLERSMLHRETLEVVRAYYAVPSAIRGGVYRLLKSIAGSSAEVAMPDSSTNPVDRTPPASSRHLTQALAVRPLSTEPNSRVWALEKVPGLPADFIQKVEHRSDSQPVLQGHNAGLAPSSSGGPNDKPNSQESPTNRAGKPI